MKTNTDSPENPEQTSAGERWTGEECRARKALLFVKAWFAKLENATGEDGPLTAIRRKFHAPVHAQIHLGLSGPCPCESLRTTVDSMLRCVGKNAANVDDPVAAIKLTYRALVEARTERDKATTEAEARLKQFLTQVEIHNRNTKEWRVALDAAQAESKELRAEAERLNAILQSAASTDKR